MTEFIALGIARRAQRQLVDSALPDSPVVAPAAETSSVRTVGTVGTVGTVRIWAAARLRDLALRGHRLADHLDPACTPPLVRF